VLFVAFDCASAGRVCGFRCTSVQLRISCWTYGRDAYFSDGSCRSCGFGKVVGQDKELGDYNPADGALAVGC
jgi:hypothetical protein